MTSSTELNIPALVTAIREIAGDSLDRVIIYGSFVYGGWNAETSDIDVAVLLRFLDFTSVEHKRLLKIERALRHLRYSDEANTLGPLADRLEFFVESVERVEALRHFHPCMESKLLRNGRVIWSSPTPIEDPAFFHAEARRQVVDRGMRAANRIIDRAREGVLLTAFRYALNPDRAILADHDHAQQCADAHTAACMCLRALLYLHDIDPSNRSMRWIVSALIAKLITADPEAAKLAALADKLPDHYCRDCYLDSATEEEVRAAIAASIRIYRFANAKTGFGDDLIPTSHIRRLAQRIAEKLDAR